MRSSTPFKGVPTDAAVACGSSSTLTVTQPASVQPYSWRTGTSKRSWNALNVERGSAAAAEKQSRSDDRSASSDASASTRNVNGTPGNTVARSRSSSASARPRWSTNGLGLSKTTSVAPARTAASRQQPMP